MSALGQKQTSAMQNAMSALHPIATAKADIGKPACLLYPRKRTCAVELGMSALGQKRTHAAQQTNLYSITSPARASTEGGIVRPSALAVLRLITNSYLVGACTGRSAGFSPLRMRST